MNTTRNTVMSSDRNLRPVELVDANGVIETGEFLGWSDTRLCFFIRKSAGEYQVVTPQIAAFHPGSASAEYPFPLLPVQRIRPFRLLPPPIRARAEDPPSSSPPQDWREWQPAEQWEIIYGEFLHPEPGDEEALRSAIEGYRPLLSSGNPLPEIVKLQRSASKLAAATLPELQLAITSDPGLLAEHLHQRWAKKLGLSLTDIGWNEECRRWNPAPAGFFEWCRQTWRDVDAQASLRVSHRRQRELLARVRLAMEFHGSCRVFISDFELRDPILASEIDQIRKLVATGRPLNLVSGNSHIPDGGFIQGTGEHTEKSQNPANRSEANVSVASDSASSTTIAGAKMRAQREMASSQAGANTVGNSLSDPAVSRENSTIETERPRYSAGYRTVTWKEADGTEKVFKLTRMQGGILRQLEDSNVPSLTNSEIAEALERSGDVSLQVRDSFRAAQYFRKGADGRKLVGKLLKFDRSRVTLLQPGALNGKPQKNPR